MGSKRLLKAKINFFTVEIPIEFILILVGLVGGLAYCIGSWLSPRTKSLKAEIKYLEGKYHRLRQDKTAEQDDKGLDLSSLLGGDLGKFIMNTVKENPDAIKNLLGSLQKQNNITDNFSQGQLRWLVENVKKQWENLPMNVETSYCV